MEVTNYSKSLYSPKGAAYLGSGGDDDDDNDDDRGNKEDLEATPSYQSRKRRHN